MLFYNHKQEFIGIDDEGLKLLNYGTLEELLGVCGDVADLFANEPGYIHNFKSFGWIDFLLHADSDAKSAIVHGNGRTFSCQLEVRQLYLCEHPSENGYMIEMTHIQSISGDEIKARTAAPARMPKEVFAPVEAPKPTPKEVFTPVEPPRIPDNEPSVSILPDYEPAEPTVLSEPSTFDVPEYQEADFDSFRETEWSAPSPFTVPEKTYEPEIYESPEPVAIVPDVSKTAEAGRYTAAEQEFLKNHTVDPSYRFDPNVAANELGLPVDLIEEFIGDFIQQSYDFKSDLFEAVMKRDMNNLKILSHKLKGVAANLRIEDAFETLSIVNTSNDPVEVEANLKCFYHIIEKLEGKAADAVAEEAPLVLEPKVFEEPSVPAPTVDISDDIYEFVLKHDDEPLVVQDEEVSDFSYPASETDEVMDYGDDLPAETFTLPETSNDLQEAFTEQLHYDKASIAGSLGIEPAFLNELIEDYKHDAVVAGQQIADAVAAFDTHLWKKTASQLKGISDHLRLIDISNELATLSETNDAQEAHKASKRLNNFLKQL